MTYLILQTALIMLAAYIFGALVGCMARRMIYGGPGPNFETAVTPGAGIADGDPDRPMIETNDGSAAREREKLEAERFARVLTQAPATAAQAETPAPVARVTEAAVEPAREPAPQQAPQPEPATEPVHVKPEPQPAPAAQDDGEPYRQVSTAAAAAATAAAASAAIAAASKTSSQETTVVAAGPAQDLTLIRGIDTAISDTLAQHGITRFEQIASWSAEDVRDAGEVFGSSSRVSRDNWIEQAKILASGGETAFSRARAGAEDFDLWKWVAATGATVVPTYPPAKSEPPPPAVDRGIDAASPRARQSVYGVGAASDSESAQRSNADLAVAESPAPSDDAGGDNDAAGVAGIAAAAAGFAGVAAQMAPNAAEADDEDTTIAVVSPAREPEQDVVSPAPAAIDDLTRIKGVDKSIEGQLVAQGITAFTQLANWKADDIQRFEQGAGDVAHGRVGRENWIEQAQILASGGETAFSREKSKGYEIAEASVPVAQDVPEPETTSDVDAGGAAAAAAAAAAASMAASGTAAEPQASAKDTAEPRAAVEAAEPEPSVRPARLADAIKARQTGGTESQKSGLAGLRSVRSQALRGEAGAAGSFDDLKRIRGIGVLIEKKLNSLGITSFEQIANWSNSEIDRLSQVLDFKGRIERENWVEQARILASGGHTEFSRRLDQDRS